MNRKISLTGSINKGSVRHDISQSKAAKKEADLCTLQIGAKDES